MSVDGLSLVKNFQTRDDMESSVAFYRTKTSWIAPLAYLNIIYKPARPEVLVEIDRILRLPDPLKRQLSVNNGLKLLSRSIFMYGVVSQAQLLDRSSPLTLPPYSILTANRESQKLEDKSVLFGGYRHNDSRVFIDRGNHSICCISADGRTTARWRSLDEWLYLEYNRMEKYFNVTGRLLDETNLPLSPGS